MWGLLLCRFEFRSILSIIPEPMNTNDSVKPRWRPHRTFEGKLDLKTDSGYSKIYIYIYIYTNNRHILRLTYSFRQPYSKIYIYKYIYTNNREESRCGPHRSFESRVVLKTDLGYPKDAGVTVNSSWPTLGIPFASLSFLLSRKKDLRAFFTI